MPTRMDDVYSPDINVAELDSMSPKQTNNGGRDTSLRALNEMLNAQNIGFGSTNQDLLDEIPIVSDSPPDSNPKEAGDDLLHLTSNLTPKEGASALPAMQSRAVEITTNRSAPLTEMIVSSGNYENPFAQASSSAAASSSKIDMVNIKSIRHSLMRVAENGEESGTSSSGSVNWRPSHMRDENEVSSFDLRPVPQFKDTLQEIGSNLRESIGTNLFGGLALCHQAPIVRPAEEEDVIVEDKIEAIVARGSHRFHFLDFATFMILAKIQLVQGRTEEFSFVCDQRELVECSGNPKSHCETCVFESNVPLETGTFSKTEIRMREKWEVDWKNQRCEVSFKNLTPIWALRVRGKFFITADCDVEAHQKHVDDGPGGCSWCNRTSEDNASFCITGNTISTAEFSKRNGIYMFYTCTVHVSEMESTFSVESVKEIFAKKSNSLAVFFQRFDKGSIDFRNPAYSKKGPGCASAASKDGGNPRSPAKTSAKSQSKDTNNPDTPHQAGVSKDMLLKAADGVS